MSNDTKNQVKSNKRNGFSKTPHTIWEAPYLTIQEIGIWSYLNSHDKDFHPPLSEISKKTRTHKNTVLKSLKRLEGFNMVKIIRGKRGSNKESNQYFIVDEIYWRFPSSTNGNHDQVHEGTGPSTNRNHDQVQMGTTKKIKENINKKINVEATHVDNSEPPISKEDFSDIFELINQIHGSTDAKTAKCISKYYIRLLKQYEEGTLNLIEKYRKGVKNGAQFDKSIRMNQGVVVFDTSFKRQFEKDLKATKIHEVLIN